MFDLFDFVPVDHDPFAQNDDKRYYTPPGGFDAPAPLRNDMPIEPVSPGQQRFENIFGPRGHYGPGTGDTGALYVNDLALPKLDDLWGPHHLPPEVRAAIANRPSQEEWEGANVPSPGGARNWSLDDTKNGLQNYLPPDPGMMASDARNLALEPRRPPKKGREI